MERLLEAPMMVLSLALGVLLLAPLLVDVSAATAATFEVVGWLIWAVFVAEYLVLLWLAPDKRQMVRTHLLELFLIAVPMLRPLRALRVLRAARALVGVATAIGMARRVLLRRGLQWFLVAVIGVVVGGAGLAMVFERQDPSSQIQSFGDALWWAIVTCTTVGYGDAFPVTPGGKAVAVVLMILGVALLSGVTANIASFFVEQDAAEETKELEDQITALHRKVDHLIEALAVTTPDTR